MSKSRIKIKLAQLATREEVEEAMTLLALAENSKRAALARIDAARLAAEQKESERLAAAEAHIAEHKAVLKDWALANPALFDKRRSLELLSGTLGFRKDTPSLALAEKKSKWEAVLGVIRALRFRKFLRVKTEVNKEAILARCGTVEKPTRFQTDTLPKLGLKIVQDDGFYIEPKLTDAEAERQAA